MFAHFYPLNPDFSDFAQSFAALTCFFGAHVEVRSTSFIIGTELLYRARIGATRWLCRRRAVFGRRTVYYNRHRPTQNDVQLPVDN